MDTSLHMLDHPFAASFTSYENVIFNYEIPDGLRLQGCDHTDVQIEERHSAIIALMARDGYRSFSAVAFITARRRELPWMGL